MKKLTPKKILAWLRGQNGPAPKWISREIEHQIDLSSARWSKKIKFQNCCFKEPIIANDAVFEHSVVFEDCELRGGIIGLGARFKGGFFLERCTLWPSQKRIESKEAHIGPLVLRDVEVDQAFHAENLTVHIRAARDDAHDAKAKWHQTCQTSVSELARASLGVNLEECRIRGHLKLEGLQCEGSLFLRNARIEGQISLQPHIPKNVDRARRSIVLGLIDMQALHLDGSLDGRGIFCGLGLSMRAAEVRGELYLRPFDPRGSKGLKCDPVFSEFCMPGNGLAIEREWQNCSLRLRGLRIAGSVHLSGATFYGPVDLFRCQIGGRLKLDAWSPMSETASALTRTKIILRTALLTGQAKEAAPTTILDLDSAIINGLVTISGAEIGGNVSARNARFLADFDAGVAECRVTKRRKNQTNPIGVSPERTQVSGGLALTLAEIKGELRLQGIHINGIASFDFCKIGGSMRAHTWRSPLDADSISLLEQSKRPNATKKAKAENDPARSLDELVFNLHIGPALEVYTSGGPSANAISDNTQISSGLTMRAIRVHGDVYLMGARVNGSIDMSGCEIDGSLVARWELITGHNVRLDFADGRRLSSFILTGANIRRRVLLQGIHIYQHQSRWKQMLDVAAEVRRQLKRNRAILREGEAEWRVVDEMLRRGRSGARQDIAKWCTDFLGSALRANISKEAYKTLNTISKTFDSIDIINHNSIDLENAKIGELLDISEADIVGRINLRGASIQGSLRMTGIRLEGELDASGIKVEEDVVFSPRTGSLNDYEIFHETVIKYNDSVPEEQALEIKAPLPYNPQKRAAIYGVVKFERAMIKGSFEALGINILAQKNEWLVNPRHDLGESALASGGLASKPTDLILLESKALLASFATKLKENASENSSLLRRTWSFIFSFLIMVAAAFVYRSESVQSWLFLGVANMVLWLISIYSAGRLLDAHQALPANEAKSGHGFLGLCLSVGAVLFLPLLAMVFLANGINALVPLLLALTAFILFSGRGRFKKLNAERWRRLMSRQSDGKNREYNSVEDCLKDWNQKMEQSRRQSAAISFRYSSIGGRLAFGDINSPSKRQGNRSFRRALLYGNLDAQSLALSGDAIIKDIEIFGCLRFEDANIEGELNLRNCRIHCDFDLRSARVAGQVFLDEGRLTSPKIKGIARLDSAHLAQAKFHFGATCGEMDGDEFNALEEEEFTPMLVSFEMSKVGNLELRGGLHEKHPPFFVLRGFTFDNLSIDHLRKIHPAASISSFWLWLPERFDDREKLMEKKYNWLLEQTLEFNEPDYNNMETWLRQRGQDDEADDVHMRMRQREMDGSKRWKTWLRNQLYLFSSGFGTKTRRLVWAWLALFITTTLVFHAPESVEHPLNYVAPHALKLEASKVRALLGTSANRLDLPVTIQNAQREAMDESRTNFFADMAWGSDGAQPESLDDWGGLSGGAWMAIRLQIPLINLFARNDWEPASREIDTRCFGWIKSGRIGPLPLKWFRYDDYASFVTLCSWVLTPLILIGWTGLLKRKTG